MEECKVGEHSWVTHEKFSTFLWLTVLKQNAYLSLWHRNYLLRLWCRKTRLHELISIKKENHSCLVFFLGNNFPVNKITSSQNFFQLSSSHSCSTQNLGGYDDPPDRGSQGKLARAASSRSSESRFLDKESREKLRERPAINFGPPQKCVPCEHTCVSS